MKTIQEQWDDFEQAVVPKDAGPIQIKEMRRAFYAGTKHLLFEIMSLGDDDVSEEAGVDALEKYHQELIEFAKRIGVDV